VPGGGSAAAYAGALGVSLLLMVARYSKDKGANKSVEQRIASTVKKGEAIQKRLLELVDLDAKAYLKLTKTKNAPKKIRNKAIRDVREVPLEVCRLCYKAIDLAPVLVKEGNKYLIADVAVACELLLSSFNGALTLAQYN
jgi:methenyltetrahydrofolate cyclohydrolase